MTKQECGDLLQSAAEHFLKKEYSQAIANLTRIIHGSDQDQLSDLSAQARKMPEIKMPLDELTAEARFRANVDPDKKQFTPFRAVTLYEKPPLILRLEEAYQQALIEEAQAQPRATGRSTKLSSRSAARSSTRNSRSRPPASQPADAHPDEDKDTSDDKAESQPSEHSINRWIDSPKSFNGNRDECQAMTRQIAYAKFLLNERIKLISDRSIKTDLIRELKLLSELGKAVTARERGAITPEERKALDTRKREEWEQRRNEMSRRAEELWRRDPQHFFMQNAIRDARMRGELPPASGQPPAAEQENRNSDSDADDSREGPKDNDNRSTNQ